MLSEAFSTSNSLIVYEWNAWSGYLLPTLFPRARRLEATPSDTTAALLRALPSSSFKFQFHINLSDTTRFPSDRDVFVRALADRGITVLNAHPTSTMKSALARLCLGAGLPDLIASQDGDPGEMLIIKTEHNYGALSERQLSPATLSSLDISPPSLLITGPQDYQIRCRRAIPTQLWSASGVRIEKFVSNPHHVFYRAYICGNNLVISRAINPNPIKKMESGLPRHNFFFRIEASPTSDAQTLAPSEAFAVLHVVRRFVDHSGLAFGTLDIVLSSADAPFIVDLNLTPYWGNELQADILEHLRSGSNLVSADSLL